MEFHNKIAEISLKKFASLPKTGKPNNKEWTVMSTIVKNDSTTNLLEVISLGTGSKCIGANLMSANGDILNDSHAEIICRRSFLKYLYKEIENFFKNGHSEIFIDKNDYKLIINPNITFHLFSTHIPCGDASIFPKNDNDNIGNCLQNDLNLSHENCPPKKKFKFDDNRTGAKCLKEDSKQDPKSSGKDFHIVGVVRTKPGRGDPTLSISCSDKIAKWTLLGIQGQLIYKLLEKPIYLSTITIAGGIPFSHEALNRAICNRTKTTLNTPFQHITPKIFQSNLNFEFCKNDSRQPCPSSIIWYKYINKVEVAVEGKKQGVTKKNLQTKAGRLSICKKELFSDFYNVVKNNSFFNINVDEYKCYLDFKNDVNCPYYNLWCNLKENIFKIWPCKNKDLLLFTYDV